MAGPRADNRGLFPELNTLNHYATLSSTMCYTQRHFKASYGLSVFIKTVFGAEGNRTLRCAKNTLKVDQLHFPKKQDQNLSYCDQFSCTCKHYCFQIPLQKRSTFTFEDFTVKTNMFLSAPLHAVLSHHSLKKPAMQFASPEKCIISDSYYNSLITNYIL